MPAVRRHSWRRSRPRLWSRLAYSKVRPQAPSSTGPSPGSWPIALGPAGSRTRPRGRPSPRCASYYGRAQGAEDRYRLTVTVNETQVAELNVTGSTEDQAVAVPSKASRSAQPNRVRFDMEGRGHFGYAVTLAGFTRDFGPDQDRTNRVASIDRRVYLPGGARARRQSVAGRIWRRREPDRTSKTWPARSRLGAKPRSRSPPTEYPRNDARWERDFLDR